LAGIDVQQTTVKYNQKKRSRSRSRPRHHAPSQSHYESKPKFIIEKV